jgi:hypothetical protein
MSAFESSQKKEEATENSYVVVPVGLVESSLIRTSDAPCQGRWGRPSSLAGFRRTTACLAMRWRETAPCSPARPLSRAWAVVNPVLRKHDRAVRYHAGRWGPRQADALVGGGWHNPAV